MESLTKLSMRLFGLPYQFPEIVDPRIKEISPVIGKTFAETIMLEAPVCTIIPGRASYLPGKSNSTKASTGAAILEAAGGNFQSLSQLITDSKDDDLRLYDFKNDYTSYMTYVNVLCRAGAIFLDINDTVTIGGTTQSLPDFDWRNYRWNSDATVSLGEKSATIADKVKKTVIGAVSDAVKSLYGGISGKNDDYKSFNMTTDGGTEGELSEVLKNFNYVQFYIDADVSPNESLNNQTGESFLKSMFDNKSSQIKEIAFMADSGGFNTEQFAEFADASAAGIQAIAGLIPGNNGLNSTLQRFINLSGNVIQGQNLIIPDIYQNSSYQKSYSITVHLRSPYGTKIGYYMDIFVPMMHLMALAMPKQESANSFSSPFLIKAYVEGVFACNLGIVDSISVNKVAESWSVSGLPSEVDVTLNITDLYSDLSMSPSTSPIQFANNSSLIEYLAVNCGMSLTSPNFEAKWDNVINTMVSAFTDVPSTVKSSIEEKVYSIISKLTSLYK